MADTFSDLIGLRLQQIGANDNTWGALLNTDVFEMLESAITGRLSQVVTGGTLDLSAAPIAYDSLILSGTLTSDQIVIVPALVKRLLIGNFTTGAFTVTVKVTGSSTFISAPATTFIDTFNTAAIILRVDGPDVGEIKHFANASVPAGFLECDGSSLLRASYPDLFTAIGTTWGSADGTHFTLPDLKTAGRFMRSRTGSVAVGTYQAETIGPHSHANTLSTTQAISLSIASDGSHSHTINISDPNHSHGPTGGSLFWVVGGSPANQGLLSAGADSSGVSTTAAAATGITASSVATGSHTHAGSTATLTGSVSITNVNNSGTENRPVTAVALACIRY